METANTGKLALAPYQYSSAVKKRVQKMRVEPERMAAGEAEGITAESEREYGDLMKFLLYFREQYASDEEFNRFIVESLREFLYDLRTFEVYISISPDSLRRNGTPRNNATSGCK
jgi:hypothetical protein